MAVTLRGIIASAGDARHLRGWISTTAPRPSLYLYGILCTANWKRTGFCAVYKLYPFPIVGLS